MRKGFIGLLALASGCITVTNNDKNGTTDTGTTTTDTNTTDTNTTDTTPPDPDNDGDGFPQSTDCDDTNAAINPDALETCDGIDNNCSGTIDDEATATVDGANYASMDDAFTAMTDGATMDLCPGTWTFVGVTQATGTITIHGVAGRDTTTISESSNLTAFKVNGDGVVNLDGVTLSGSNLQTAKAVDVSVGGTVNVTASHVTGNWQGFYVHGETNGKTPVLTIADSDVDANGSADVNGGGIGMYLSGNVSVTNSSVSANTGGNGGGLSSTSTFIAPTITLTGSTFDGNVADNGGGVFVTATAYWPGPTITDTTFSNNTANVTGGGLFLANAPLVGSGVQIVTNTATIAGGGAAITASPISNALISANSAPGGGGVAVLFDADFNGAPFGNDLTAVVLDSNTGDYGAGIWVDDQMSVSVDGYSAVTLNTASYDGGGAWLDGLGATLTSLPTGADFGTTGTNDNAPNDVSGLNWAGGVVYEGPTAFVCTGDGVCI